jgi:hypothetical protein
MKGYGMKKVSTTVTPHMPTTTLGKVPGKGGMGSGMGKSPKLVLGGNSAFFKTKGKK